MFSCFAVTLLSSFHNNLLYERTGRAVALPQYGVGVRSGSIVVHISKTFKFYVKFLCDRQGFLVQVILYADRSCLYIHSSGALDFKIMLLPQKSWSDGKIYLNHCWSWRPWGTFSQSTARTISCFKYIILHRIYIKVCLECENEISSLMWYILVHLVQYQLSLVII